MQALERYHRHEQFLVEDGQARLQKAKVLIAGCGAGSPVAAHLARLGIGTAGDGMITLTDPDYVSPSNLNRQDFSQDDAEMRVPKAIALARRVNTVNRDVRIKARTDGVTEENAGDLVRSHDVIVDMIDIAAPGPMLALHNAAIGQRKPVVTGLDLGFEARTYVFDYRDPSAMTLHGFLGLPTTITPEEISTLDPIGLTAQFVLAEPPQTFTSLEDARRYYNTLLATKSEEIFTALPDEMRPVVMKMVTGESDFISQSGLAANTLGLMQQAAVKRLVLNEPIRPVPYVAKVNIDTIVGAS